MDEVTLPGQTSVTQDVGRAENSLIVGVQINEAHFTVLSGEVNAQAWRNYLKENTAPYRFLAPYRENDHLLFKGRDSDILRVIHRLAEQQLLIVHGEAGVGKTSLLAAGVTPHWVGKKALVVQIDDYQHASQAIREAMLGKATIHEDEQPGRATRSSSGKLDDYQQLVLTLREALKSDQKDLALVELAQRAIAATRRPLILIFDQFERLFEAPFTDQQREAFAQEIAAALAGLDREHLHIIVSVRTDALEAAKSRLAAHFPRSWHTPLELRPLTHEEAVKAIEQPLEVLDFPVQYYGDLVSKRLVPELDELSEAGGIEPSHLQIVCHWLYRDARDSALPRAGRDGIARGRPIIDERLYNANNGAEGIMASYTRKTLDSLSAEDRALAERILLAAAAPGLGTWLLPSELGLDDIPPDKAAGILEHLVEVCLLVRRIIDGRPSYAFTSEVVRKSARNLGGQLYVQQLNASDELERVWETWLARHAIASVGSLRALAGADLNPASRALTPPFLVRIVFLLRSAVARDEPVGPWLRWLRTNEGGALIRELDGEAGDLSTGTTRATLYQAERLLGLTDLEPDRTSPDPQSSFGNLARSAVEHEASVVRRTAALALVASNPERGLTRLRNALEKASRGGQRWKRTGELLGTLADADIGVEKSISELRLGYRAPVWFWRAWRRAASAQHYIFTLVVGGALGGGLALALMRALTSILTPSQPPFMVLGLNLYYGSILSGITALGILLALPMLLRYPTEVRADEMQPTREGPFASGRLPLLLRVLTGGLAFGIGHLLVQVLTSGDPTNLPLLVVLMGFVAGLGLSASLYGMPSSRLGMRPAQLLARLALAGFGFFLAQLILLLALQPASLSITLSATSYCAELSSKFEPQPQQCEGPDSLTWYNYLALLDSTLVGIVLAAGMMIGLARADKWWSWWRDLVNRIPD